MTIDRQQFLDELKLREQIKKTSTTGTDARRREET
jgi:hypothetical protein